MTRGERVVLAAFVAFAFLAATFRIGTWDVWWHLATGRLILSGAGIPRVDPFSFTAAGHEWIDHEWLFQVFVFLVHEAGGAVGLTLAKAALVAATAAVVFRFVRRESGLGVPAAALLLVPFVLAGRNRFIVRPELFTVLFAALVLAALLRRRERPARARDLLWMAPLFAIWANLHGGLIVGVALLGLFVAGRVAQEGWARLRRTEVVDDGMPGLGAAAIALAAATAAGLANPFFHRVYEVPFQLTALMESGPFRNAEWTPPRLPGHWLFFVVAAASTLVVVVAAVRRRRVCWPALLPFLFLLAIGLRYVRNTALFSLLVPLLLVRLLRDRPTADDEAAPRFAGLRAAPAAGLLAVLGVVLAATGGGQAAGLGVDRGRIPVKAVDFLEVARPPGHLLNAYAFGGYVAWRLWPRVPIFIDGRNEVFVDLRRRLAESVTDSRKWFALLDEYEIGHTLLQYIDALEVVQEMDPAGGPSRVLRRPYGVNHFPPAEWALVYWDDTAMVHVRRTEEAAPLIAASAYEHVRPESVEHQLDAIRRGEVDREAALGELARKLAEDPECVRAMRLFMALGSMR